ncbi:MAG: pantoate--beta-alanine ligase [Gammaproteobacteria bacterium]|nr:pantoate--beta-alanine ligase [Gammaproteobacteria bacterium]MCF6362276.1 pantoate--beta-alanine ligase [Gammaproteobacteria bacterium]
MQSITTIADLRRRVSLWRQAGERIALVPTMGNLHAGHLQLVETARRQANHVVVSIFVNPMQFSDASGGDFEHYPRTFEVDQKKLMESGVDLLFFPAQEEMYPAGFKNVTRVMVPGISDILCGVFRPSHFVGVATVVAKFFNMVQPDVAVFGEKDYQQLLVIRRFTEELCFPVEIIGVPTVREADGLAMSSRNQYLSAEERQRAAALYRTLQTAKERLISGEGDIAAIESDAEKTLREAGFCPEYFTVCRADDLQPATTADTALVILTATWLGETRLIDNIQLRRHGAAPA